MNPFDWTGPNFLIFYIALIGFAVAALYAAILIAEDGPAPALPLADPYQIAWLRGGAPETVRIAVLSLLDREAIDLDITGIVANPDKPTTAAVAGPPIERAVLDCCAQGRIGLRELAADRAVAAAAESCRRGLEQLKLVPSDEQMDRRRKLMVAAAFALLVVAFIKLVVALDRGHSNVLLLILLGIASPFIVWLPVRVRRTRLGDRMLADLRQLFGALRERAATIRRGEMTSEAMLLAAAFGLSALPAGSYVDLLQAYRRVDQANSGSGCGGGGGGCGGGGGGGGCGGCGSG
ncbi:MAG TPA: TIGR04222 domain-containing membrane protein [Stellaceae bacterium]|nr:TIGR04222 domain-containing membrane protein [Stellaceae bacterium]